MFLRKYWLPLSVFLVAIAGVGLYLLAIQPPPEPIVIYKTVEPEKPTEQPKAEVPVGDTSQGGHSHADGTWHAEPHVPVETPAAPPLSLSDADLAAIPEDISEPDIRLPADLSDSQALNRWTETFTAEWQKYVHALDPRMERLSAEMDQMIAELPPENAPDFAAAKAKLLAKKEEHSKLRAEQNARVHKWGAASQAFGDYVIKRASRK